jgi:serine/threonine protein kinase
MTTPDLRKVEEIFHAALDREPDQLNAFLNERCAGDDILRREVEALLALHRQAGSFIETPIVNVADSGIGDDQENDFLIGQTIGHYKISQRISAGGMGEVYLATDTIVGRKAALKFLNARFTGDEGRLKRFQQEARAVAGLNHPNILTIYEVGDDHSLQYIASELIEGETLRQRLARGRMQLNEAVEIAIQVAGALAAAHSAGIVHRDVKPENIMLRPDGYVKVLDFGIAKLAEQEVPVTMPQEEALLLVETNLGSVLGTVRYMSPEQARGAPVDKRTDIWSLGIVLYEMAVGHAPFAGDTPREVMTAILKTEPRPFSSYTAQIPGELEPIVSKALQKDPGQRYQNASEMLGDLKALRRKLEFAAEIAKSAPKKSIAVFPFENLSGNPDNVYLAHGIHEEILTRLSNIADLKVVSRRSTQRYESEPKNLPEIAQQLGVAHVLEGSIQIAGDQVRVHVQLINAQSDSHLWAEKYDRKLADIFALESEIATEIADTLQAKLTGAEQRAIASRPTENSEAHQLYLKGLYYWNKYFAPGFEKSRDYFQRAIDLDPNYAPAYAGLAGYYGFASANGLMRPSEGWPKCEAAANRALALDDMLAWYNHALAAIKLYWCRDWPAAERAFRRGIDLNPNFAEIRVHYANCLVLFDRNEDALIEVRRGVELDPFSSRFNVHWARILFFMRQYDRAIDQFHATLELDPNYAMPHEWLGYAYEKKGMHKEATAEWRRALNLSGASEEASIVERTYASSGFDAAIQALAKMQLERCKERTARDEYVPAADYVTAYTRLGDKEEAFTWLAKTVEERNCFPFEIRIDPRFDPLRSDSRFEKIIDSAAPKQ